MINVVYVIEMTYRLVITVEVSEWSYGSVSILHIMLILYEFAKILYIFISTLTSKAGSPISLTLLTQLQLLCPI